MIDIFSRIPALKAVIHGKQRKFLDPAVGWKEKTSTYADHQKTRWHTLAKRYLNILQEIEQPTASERIDLINWGLLESEMPAETNAANEAIAYDPHEFKVNSNKNFIPMVA